MVEESTREIVARIDERTISIVSDIKKLEKATSDQTKFCHKTIDGLHSRVSEVDSDVGSNTRSISALKKIVKSLTDSVEDIKKCVTNTMSGRERASIYIAVITSISSLAGVIVIALTSA